MKFRSFLILLALAAVILLSSYLGMEYAGLSKKTYKTTAGVVSMLLLVSAFLIKDEDKWQHTDLPEYKTKRKP